ncbi:unnamed protein product [Closterium sp. NIES-54]
MRPPHRQARASAALPPLRRGPALPLSPSRPPICTSHRDVTCSSCRHCCRRRVCSSRYDTRRPVAADPALPCSRAAALPCSPVAAPTLPAHHGPAPPVAASYPPAPGKRIAEPHSLAESHHCYCC